VIAIALVLGAMAGWLLKPKGVGPLWLRLRILGRLSGASEMSASDTHSAYARRWIEHLPRDTGKVKQSLTDIAELSTKHHYSREGLADNERVHLMDSWQHVLRAFPSLTWRRFRRKTG
jgi:hypothetical protein